MAIYYYGEVGYNEEGSSESLEEAKEAAAKKSTISRYTSIAVWDEADKFLLVAINGDCFLKQQQTEIDRVMRKI